MRFADRAIVLKAIETFYADRVRERFLAIQDARPYASLMEQLRGAGWAIKDITDDNEDASFVYLLKKGNESFYIQLSMLGPYVFGLKQDCPDPPFCSQANPGSTPAERELLRAFDDFGLEFPEEKILFEPIDVPVNYCEPEDVKIYQALFSDVEWVTGYPTPWGKEEYVALRDRIYGRFRPESAAVRVDLEESERHALRIDVIYEKPPWRNEDEARAHAFEIGEFAWTSYVPPAGEILEQVTVRLFEEPLMNSYSEVSPGPKQVCREVVPDPRARGATRSAER